jgi:hypothetical protein
MRSAVAILALVACGGAQQEPPSPQPASGSASPGYPMLDGHCGDVAGLAQERHVVAPGVELFVFQDRDYVWLCYTIPNGNFGMVDVAVAAPGLAEPMNLHVSAQLGEWPIASPDLAPAEATSPQWWNHHGWTAAVVPFNGVEETDGQSRYKFKPTPGRELQLGKARFGRGTWKLALSIRGITGPDGVALTPRFPASGDHVLEVW